MVTIVGMFPNIYAITFTIWIYLFGCATIGTYIWTNIRTKTWKPENSGNLDVRFGEESYSPR